MTLTEDQRALVRLLLAGDSYEQIAEILGESPGEVRSRAHQAAAALEREADPDLSAAVVGDRLREIESGTPVLPAAGPVTAPARARLRVNPWLAAVGAMAIVLVVLAVAVLGGGGDDGQNAPAADQEDAVSIQLRPVGDAKATGTMTIIRIGDQPAVDLDIRGLTPSGAGQTYVLWFVGSGGRSLPVAFQAVGRDGELKGRTPIANAAAGLLPSLDTAELALVSQRDAAQAIRTGAQTGTLPLRVGSTVLRAPLRG